MLFNPPAKLKTTVENWELENSNRQFGVLNRPSCMNTTCRCAVKSAMHLQYHRECSLQAHSEFEMNYGTWPLLNNGIRPGQNKRKQR